MHSPLQRLLVMNAHHGQPTDNVEPLIAPAARRMNRPAVQLDEMPHNRQAETEAGMFARRAAVRLAKALEDMWKKVRRDADARVG